MMIRPGLYVEKMDLGGDLVWNVSTFPHKNVIVTDKSYLEVGAFSFLSCKFSSANFVVFRDF